MLVPRRKGTKTKVPIEEMTRSLGSSKGLLQLSVGARGVWFLLFEDGEVPMNDQPLTTIVHSEKSLVVIMVYGVHYVDPCLF